MLYKKLYLITLLLFLTLMGIGAIAFSTGILIEDASATWQKTPQIPSALLAMTAKVQPRIVAEYASTLFEHDISYPEQLLAVTSDVPEKIIIEYASSAAQFGLEALPTASAKQFTGPLDVVLANDSSTSMSNNDPNNLRLQASKNFVGKLDPAQDRVGVVSWDEDIDFVQSLTDNFDLVKRRISEIDSDGSTNLNEGLKAAIDELEENGRTEETKAILFLTDGDGKYTPQGESGSQVDRAVDLDVMICTIGLGSGPDEAKLKEIAETTGCAYYSAGSPNTLNQIFDTLAPQR